MRANFGEHFKLTIFGESTPGYRRGARRSACGAQIDKTYIARQMARRARAMIRRPRRGRRADAVRVLSGVLGGRATGAPLCA